MMESVVAEGTGKNSKVVGFRVGGKTGTSEDGVNTNKYVTSFIGVAPTEKPLLTILVTLYTPTGEAGPPSAGHLPSGGSSGLFRNGSAAAGRFWKIHLFRARQHQYAPL